MPRRARPHKTFHISVPEQDTLLMEWLAVQYNQSASVRELIREAVEKHGMADLFIGQPASRTPGVRGLAKQPKAQAAAEAKAAREEKLRNAYSGSKAEEEAIECDEDPKAEAEAASPAKPKREGSSPPAAKKKTGGGIRLDAGVLNEQRGEKKINEETSKKASKKKNVTTIESLKDMMDI